MLGSSSLFCAFLNNSLICTGIWPSELESNKFQLVWPLLWDLSRLFCELPQLSTGLIPALLLRLLLLLVLLFALILFANFSCVFFCIIFPPSQFASFSFWIQHLAFMSLFFCSFPFISLFKISSNEDPPSTHQHLKKEIPADFLGTNKHSL